MVLVVKGSSNLPAISRLPTENEKTLQASLRLFTLSRQKGLLLSSKTYLKSGCLNSIIENKRYDKKGRTEIFLQAMEANESRTEILFKKR